MKPLTVAEEEGIEQAAAEIRQRAADYYHVEVYPGDLPDPLTVTPTQYERQAHTLAMARRMVEVEQELEEAPEEPGEESLEGKIPTPNDYAQLFQKGMAALRKRSEAEKVERRVTSQRWLREQRGR